MKKIFLSSVLLLTAVVAMAIPARPGLWKTITLADGTELRVQLKGDEHLNYWQAADGRCFQSLDKGQFVPVDMASLRTEAAERVGKLRKAQAETMEQGRRNASYVGQRKGLVILVEYTDIKFAKAHTREKYLDIMNKDDYTSSDGFIGSVADYFREQSNGVFELEFDVAGPYTLAHERSYYGANRTNSSGQRITDMRSAEMIREALKMADADVNYKDYLWDSTTEVPQVYVLYAGYGEADSGEADAIWPHMSYLTNSYGYISSVTYDGVRLSRYACGNEVHPDYYGRGFDVIEGIGTFCHEFSHCLGYPDFYDTQNGEQFGTGSYDLMCSGSYNGMSFCPAGYTSYEKMLAGWLSPIELKSSDVSVTDQKPLSENGDAYIIYNPGNSKEYYMIENRQRTGWDAQLPGAGLMVLHVDYDQSLWNNNMPNSVVDYYNDHERMAYFKANNNVNAPAGHPYPYNGNDSLTVSSLPAATLYNNNTDGTKLLHKGLKNIRRNGDGTMAFDFIANDNLDPTLYAEFYESFDQCNGKGGNDNTWSGATVGTGKFSPDVSGWLADNATGASQCAKFGTASVAGEATTPMFYVDGESFFSFKAAPFGSDATALALSVVKEGTGTVKLSQSSVTMTNKEWTKYQLTLTGKGFVRIKFSHAKRFFLDELRASKDATSGISEAYLPSVRTDGRIYTLDGRCLGTDFSVLKKGLYIVNGKKILK